MSKFYGAYLLAELTGTVFVRLLEEIHGSGASLPGNTKLKAGWAQRNAQGNPVDVT